MSYRTARRQVDIEFLKVLVTWYKENDLDLPPRVRLALDNLSEYWVY